MHSQSQNLNVLKTSSMILIDVSNQHKMLHALSDRGLASRIRIVHQLIIKYRNVCLALPATSERQRLVEYTSAHICVNAFC